MTYQQTIDFLFTSLPMYQRVGDSAIKKDLTNIRKLCQMLHEPQLQFSCIHVAGTNGKGSTSHMLSSIFQAAGKKVGLYTSPHYVDFRERIKVNGQLISETDVIRFVEKHKTKWATIKPSFFEITVAMAFDHFRSRKVDIAIIETGLGGRLDSTNVILPLMSVITNIGYDHMQLLGQTLPEIASEKAGIIKKNTPVVIGEWHKETSLVFKNKASAENAPIFFASRHIRIKKHKGDLLQSYFNIHTKSAPWLGEIVSDLTGPYQQKNIRTVLEACWVWNQYFPHQYLTDKIIKSGLRSVKQSTNMIGRWMIIRKDPLVIADAAHNIDGIKNIIPEILRVPAETKHFVLGFVNDKDIKKILSLFPVDAKYYWCSPDIPRGKSAQETQQEGASLGLAGLVYESVFKAYSAAVKSSLKKDFIFIGGSSYVVGDFLAKYE